MDLRMPSQIVITLTMFICSLLQVLLLHLSMYADFDVFSMVLNKHYVLGMSVFTDLYSVGYTESVANYVTFRSTTFQDIVLILYIDDSHYQE